ncbi:methyltransferase domain-containing protein [Colletotrichum higginsianum]|nr:methyltransferase domain-containing protein [Colletotrichum higginsianum]
MADPTPAYADPLEADNGNENYADDDADSAMGVSILESSSSMTSSIMQYREENGRTYHAFREGTIPLSGGQEKPLRRVLDAGTGTGIWAMDFGNYDNLQPRVPPNVTFYIDDLEDDWTYSYKFDFVYGRMLTGSIADWPRFIHQSYEFLEPGGWIELTDILLDLQSDDGTIGPDCAAQRWAAHMREAAAIWKRPLDSCLFYKQQLAEAGFTNVTERVYKWPSNPWPKDGKFKELGMWTYENLGVGLSGLSLALFTRALGWSKEQLEVFLVDVRKDMKDRSIHGWWPIYVVYAQKPE